MKNKIILCVSLAILVTPLWAADAPTINKQDSAAPATPAVTPDATTTAPVAGDQSGFSRGSVVRSAFTTAIADRQPSNDLKSIPNNISKVFYYTELRDMSGQVATHRWEHNGEVKAEIKFNVRGPRWRVWSSKNMVPGWTGDWKVSVINGAGEVISEDVFKYTDAEVAKTPAPVTAPAAATQQ